MSDMVTPETGRWFVIMLQGKYACAHEGALKRYVDDGWRIVGFSHEVTQQQIDGYRARIRRMIAEKS